jgi:hypothetical protein
MPNFVEKKQSKNQKRGKRTVLRFTQSVPAGTLVLDPSSEAADLSKFIKHSCNPTVLEIEGFWFTRRDVAKQEHLTFAFRENLTFYPLGTRSLFLSDSVADRCADEKARKIADARVDQVEFADGRCLCSHCRVEAGSSDITQLIAEERDIWVRFGDSVDPELNEKYQKAKTVLVSAFDESSELGPLPHCCLLASCHAILHKFMLHFLQRHENLESESSAVVLQFLRGESMTLLWFFDIFAIFYYDMELAWPLVCNVAECALALVSLWRDFIPFLNAPSFLVFAVSRIFVIYLGLPCRKQQAEREMIDFMTAHKSFLRCAWTSHQFHKEQNVHNFYARCLAIAQKFDVC